jgi:hypothetical protein
MKQPITMIPTTPKRTSFQKSSWLMIKGITTEGDGETDKGIVRPRAG